jgi:putative peptidoglycan binding protein
LGQAAGGLVLRLWAKALHRPVDGLALLTAIAATGLIVVNAVFLQSGAHPAPFVVIPASPTVAGATRPKAPEEVAVKAMPQAIPARSNDPIAELIGPSPRILAVQRVLAEYGYGQIKPSGILDDTTSAAIETFEREHKLPVTGRVSDRLVGNLSAMVGHPVQ